MKNAILISVGLLFVLGCASTPKMQDVKLGMTYLEVAALSGKPMKKLSENSEYIQYCCFVDGGLETALSNHSLLKPCDPYILTFDKKTDKLIDITLDREEKMRRTSRPYNFNNQSNPYGQGVHMNQYGQPVKLKPDFGGVEGEQLQIKRDAYGPGVHMDQYGRPVRE